MSEITDDLVAAAGEEGCGAKCLVWPAGKLPHDQLAGIAVCQRAAHSDETHIGLLDHEVTTFDGGRNRPEITWLDSDRRTFRDTLEMCDWSGVLAGNTFPCTLPADHHGDHAP